MLFEILSLLLAVLAFTYWTMTRRNTYWKDRGVPYREPKFFFGNIQDRLTFKTSYHVFYRQFYQDFSGHKYVGLYEGRIPTLMIRDPDLIRNIMGKDFAHFADRTAFRFNVSKDIKYMLTMISGSHWRRVRAALTPTFTSGKIKMMLETVDDCALEMVDYLKRKISKSGSPTIEGIDTKDLFGKVALEVIASTAFGVNSHSMDDSSTSEFVQKISKFNSLSLLSRYILLSLLVLNIPKWLAKHITLSFFNMETVSYLSKVYRETAKYRTDNKIRKNDFLQLLLDAQQVHSDGEKGTETNEEAVITEDVAVGQSVLFFIAGYETSSSLLALATYSLSREPEIQNKLREEILTVLGDDKKITYEKVNRMPYLDMVLSETLRMYPPLARLDRVCTKSYKIGDLEIPVGSRVTIPCVGIHMDPLYYPEPDKFIPERFTPEAIAARHFYVYMPFGLGPRNCVGMRFAQMSTKIIMIHLLTNFTIEQDVETPPEFLYDERSMLLKPKGGKLKVKLRTVSDII